ncbi:HET domain-containing protein [Fusarium falciforme]|uniref:HET domain-containing protein n=1 Tax=Fusarium falciforme TaxID=195108 RepID=UPI002300317E|nr:HET domain-containing protein [Fusarium falciforme]WAO94944.1 HET domain-containing protein [Fusarium falciforme]
MTSPEKIDIGSSAGAALVYEDVASLDVVQEQIRILHLEPGWGSAPISCTIHRISLTSDPPAKYEALSYTWGDPKVTREIIVNGYLVNVTFNLYSALYRLRQAEEMRVLWVDALCINQTDVDERGQQVGLMGKIYSICDNTVIWIDEPPFETWPAHWFGDERDHPSLIWLGNEFVYYSTLQEPADPASVDIVFHVFANLRLIQDSHLFEQPLFTDLTGANFAYPPDYNSYRSMMAQALAPFADSPWWTRIWTVQECILPQRATFIYGPVSIELSFMLQVFSALSRHMLADCCSTTGAQTNPELMPHLRKLGLAMRPIDQLRSERREGPKLSLWTALGVTRSRFATDDRDRVFGVLGLVNSWIREPIVPKYRAKTEEIYTLATLDEILATNSLSPLHFPLQKDIYPDVPSWVIDWTAGSNVSLRLNVYQWTQEHYLQFYVSHKQPSHMVARDCNRVLEVKGRQCDRVALVGPTCKHGIPKDKRNVYCQWFRLFELDRNPSRLYKTGEPYFDAFWKCLCWDLVLSVDGPAEKAHFRRSKGTTDSYEAFVAFAPVSPYSVFHPEGLSPEDREAAVHFDPRFDIGQHAGTREHTSETFITEQLIGGITLNTAMFMTESGYLGLGPAETQVGDEVWCLFGSWMPFVLRPTGKTQEVVAGKGEKPLRSVLGICYVHGAMDGEVADDESLPIETVYLA